MTRLHPLFASLAVLTVCVLALLTACTYVTGFEPAREVEAQANPTSTPIARYLMSVYGDGRIEVATLTPTPFPTFTFTPTRTPPPTFTPHPSPTPAATMNATPTQEIFTITPVPICTGQVIAGAGANVRSGPGLEHGIVHVLPVYSPITAYGQGYDTNGVLWYRIDAYGDPGWIASWVVECAG